MGEATRLTDLEIKIMNVLWAHDEAMTIQEITDGLEDKKISMPSVKQSIRRMLKKKSVMVCESVLVATVYARTFRPCFTHEEFLAAEYTRLQNSVYGGRGKNPISTVAALMYNYEESDITAEDIKQLYIYIDEKKKQIESCCHEGTHK